MTTFLAGEVATWTGLVEGEEVEEEQVKLGACYKAPLNAQVTGGLLEWRGPGSWSPASVCVDWRSSNMLMMRASGFPKISAEIAGFWKALVAPLPVFELPPHCGSGKSSAIHFCLGAVSDIFS